MVNLIKVIKTAFSKFMSERRKSKLHFTHDILIDINKTKTSVFVWW